MYEAVLFVDDVGVGPGPVRPSPTHVDVYRPGRQHGLPRLEVKLRLQLPQWSFLDGK